MLVSIFVSVLFSQVINQNTKCTGLYSLFSPHAHISAKSQSSHKVVHTCMCAVNSSTVMSSILIGCMLCN